MNTRNVDALQKALETAVMTVSDPQDIRSVAEAMAAMGALVPEAITGGQVRGLLRQARPQAEPI